MTVCIECNYAEYRILFIVMLKVIALCVDMQSVITLNVVAPIRDKMYIFVADKLVTNVISTQSLCNKKLIAE